MADGKPLTSLRHPDESPLLWTWSVDDPSGRGARGVTDDQATARRRLGDALAAMPDGYGTLRPARLDVWAYPYPGYTYGAALVHAGTPAVDGRR